MQFYALGIVLPVLSVLFSSSISCWAYYAPLRMMTGKERIRQQKSRSLPLMSRATNLPNQIYEWRNQKIRYQVAEPIGTSSTEAPTVVLVHGLFANGDHWRKTLKGLSDAGYRAYAIDLLGCGYSSKPPRTSEEAQLLNGENGRFFSDDMMERSNSEEGSIVASNYKSKKRMYPPILHDVILGTPSGGTRYSDVDLRHPLSSPYNFYTWAEQISDFCQDVILPNSQQGKTTIVCNSIGSISSLQAVIDAPDIFDGVFIVSPNFRELHSSEVAIPAITMPIVRFIQSCLREYGYPLFQALAKPDTVAQILRVPYHVRSAIDEELVDVLLSPLLTPGAADVIFDLLSYSAGPLPEQLLSDPAYPLQTAPVWICYGCEDPWTPGKRVERMISLAPVERVVPLPNAGHCPHDETPELVNPLLMEFLQRAKLSSRANGSSSPSNVEDTKRKGIEKPYFAA